MSITPFHFACHVEERIRALCTALDPALGDFIQILRRFSLTEKRASLQIGAKPAAGEEFTVHVTFTIQTVPQKDMKTAFNCVLECASEKMLMPFRLLLTNLEESEPRLLKVVGLLQRAFTPLNYTTAKVTPIPDVDIENKNPSGTLETAQNLLSSVAKPANNEEDLAPEAMALTGGKKYIVEDAPATDGSIRMRTHDGKYVPEGELPSKIIVGKTNAPITGGTPTHSPLPSTSATTPPVEPAAPATPPAAVETPATPPANQ